MRCATALKRPGSFMLKIDTACNTRNSPTDIASNYD